MDRFWSKVEIGPELECWEWKAFRHPIWKYGRFGWDGKVWQAHRVAYTLTHGPIPLGFLVRHSCDNPPCCNPSHLLLGKDKQNSEDRESRNRGNQPKGSRNGFAKFPQELIESIRTMSANGVSRRAIVTATGVSSSHVHRIIHGQSWKHI